VTDILVSAGNHAAKIAARPSRWAYEKARSLLDALISFIVRFSLGSRFGCDYEHRRNFSAD